MTYIEELHSKTGDQLQRELERTNRLLNDIFGDENRKDIEADLKAHRDDIHKVLHERGEGVHAPKVLQANA